MIVDLKQKRKHLRMGCSGVASLHPLGCGAGVSGRVVDVSQQGCLLTFDAPLRLEMGAVVEICFTVHRLSFRIRSRVASQRGATFYGFEFLAMSRSGRGHVAELVEELAAAKMKQLEGARARSGSPAIELRRLPARRKEL